jgi:hypothetical protein
MENRKTVQHKNSCAKKMKCPYLSSASKKECVKMLAENMNGDLSEFDLKHFCDGNPVYCYYFRLPRTPPNSRPQKVETIVDMNPIEPLTPQTLRFDTPLKPEQRLMHKTEP